MTLRTQIWWDENNALKGHWKPEGSQWAATASKTSATGTTNLWPQGTLQCRDMILETRLDEKDALKSHWKTLKGKKKHLQTTTVITNLESDPSKNNFHQILLRNVIWMLWTSNKAATKSYGNNKPLDAAYPSKQSNDPWQQDLTKMLLQKFIWMHWMSGTFRSIQMSLRNTNFTKFVSESRWTLWRVKQSSYKELQLQV